MFKNYLKVAWRNLFRSKVTSFINIIGLSCGMAVAMLIGFWIQDEVTYDQSHKNYDHLAQVYITQTYGGITRTDPAIAFPTGAALRNEFASDFEHVALASWDAEHLLTSGEQRLLRTGMHVESDFPKMFSLDLISGAYDNLLNEPNSILISKSLGEALFGDVDPMGQTIRVDATSDLQVTGVYEDLPDNSTLKTAEFFLTWEYFLSQNAWAERSRDKWNNHAFQLYAQKKEHTDFDALSEKIRDIEKPHSTGGNPELMLFPMSRWHLYSDFKDGKNVGGYIQFVRLFGIVGIFVLFLACINFMNLSTARSQKRAKEVGVRKTIGSSRRQLIGQFLSESMIVVFLALGLALLMVQVSLGWFNNLADKQIGIPWNNIFFLVTLVGFVIFTGLIAGSYPAFYLSSFPPLRVLRNSLSSGRVTKVPRQVLVTFQFIVSVALIIGTIVVFQQIEYAKKRPLGYDQNGLIQFYTNNELENKYEVLRQELLRTGNVKSVSHSSSPVTMVWANWVGFDWEGKDPEFDPSFAAVACSPKYGETVGWEIIQGRDFSSELATDTLAAILNEAALELIGTNDIIGKTIKKDNKSYQVIGVTKNLIMESPWRPVKPTFFHLDSDWVNMYMVKLKSGIPVQQALSAVEGVYEKLSPSSPFDFQFVDSEFESKFRAEERIGKLARIFAILAIFISCLGLFGLSAFVAEQKIKEIGIRKVLGASVSQLWAMQSRGFIALVLLASLIAVPLSWYFLDTWLSSYEYRIELGWNVFILAAFLALIVTFFTVSFQSIKAALANPVDSLKAE